MDDFVIVEGGLVQNYPSIPVYDFDVLDTWPVGEEEVREVEELMRRMQDSEDAYKLVLWIGRCELWLDRYRGPKEDLPTG